MDFDGKFKFITYKYAFMKGSLCLKIEKSILPHVQALNYPTKISQPSSPASPSIGLVKSFKKSAPLIKPKEDPHKNLEKTNTFETQASQTSSNLQLRLKLRPYKGVVIGKKHLKRPHAIKPWNSRDHNKIKRAFFLNLEEDALLRPYTSVILSEKHQKEFNFKEKLFYWRKKKLSQYKFSKHNSLSPNSKSTCTVNNSKYSTRQSITHNSLLETSVFSELKARFSLKDYFLPPILNNSKNKK